MSGARRFKLQFPQQVIATVVVVGAVALYPLMEYTEAEIFYAAIAGVALSVLNVFMGYAAIEYSFEKSYTHFLQIVLGGMAVRLLVMSGLLLVFIAVFKFHTVALVVSLFIMYIIFLALEVVYIHNKWQTKIQNS